MTQTYTTANQLAEIVNSPNAHTISPLTMVPRASSVEMVMLTNNNIDAVEAWVAKHGGCLKKFDNELWLELIYSKYNDEFLVVPGMFITVNESGIFDTIHPNEVSDEYFVS